MIERMDFFSFLREGVFKEITRRENMEKFKNCLPKFRCYYSSGVDFFISESRDIKGFIPLLAIDNFYLLGKEDIFNKYFNLIKPAISICIPTTVNRRDILKKTISAWNKQKHIHPLMYEIVIVVNGKDSYKFASELEVTLNSYPFRRKIVAVEESNIGLARAISVAASSSDLLLLANDDTLPVGETINKHLLYHILFQNKKIAVVGRFFLHPRLENSKAYIVSKLGLDFPQNRLSRGFYRKVALFATNNLSVKKEYLYESGNFSYLFAKGAEDSDLGEKFLKNGGTIFLADDLIAYHYHNFNHKETFRRIGKTNFLLINHLDSQILTFISSDILKLTDIDLISSYLEKNFLNGIEYALFLEELYYYLDGLTEEYLNSCNLRPFRAKKHNFGEDKPKVSIIITPNKINNTAIAALSLKSLFSQNYQDFEVIAIINDNSHIFQQLIAKASERFHNLKIFSFRKNASQPQMKNYAVSKSRGNILVFFDVNSYMLPGAISLRVEFMLRNGFDFVYGDNLNAIDAKLCSYFVAPPKELKKFFLYQLEGNELLTGTVAIKKDLFKGMGGFNESLGCAAEYDLWNKVVFGLPNTRIGIVRFPTYIYNLRNKARMETEIDAAICRLIDMVREKLDSEQLFKSAFEKILRRKEKTPLAALKLYNILKKNLRNSKKLQKLLFRKYGNYILNHLYQDKTRNPQKEP